MAAKKRGLGRGLDALLGGGTEVERASEPAQSQESLRHMPVDLLQRGRYQPRTDMHADRLQELADSIRAQGVVQPIVVRPVDGDRYEIIAGERRWRAAQMAGLHEVPAVVREISDRVALAMALIENIQRENLNALEEANAYQRLQAEFEMTHQQVAEAVGKSRVTVSNLLRLLELNDEVKRLLENGDLEMGHCRALLALKGSQQTQAAQQVVEKALNVREAEELVRRLSNPPAPKPGKAELDPNVRRLQTDISERIGARVNITQGSRGKGRLSIDYNSLEELEGILEHIR